MSDGQQAIWFEWSTNTSVYTPLNLPAVDGWAEVKKKSKKVKAREVKGYEL